MEAKTKADILEHAKAEFPRECCGLIIIEKGRETYVPCKNIARQNNAFIIDPADYVLAYSRGSILSVVHSHCNQRAAPSQIDLVSCETTKLPWHIVSLPNEEWVTFHPTGYKAPLFGRHYQYGVLDCYTIVVDWYKEALGIELRKRINYPDNWWREGGDIFMQHFKEDGFRVVEDNTLQEGDVLLLQCGAPVVNHLAVYLEPNLMLHHHQGRLSTRDVYGGYYRKHTRCAIRYFGENKE